MSSAFVELLQKSNLDYIITRKSFKAASRNDDIIFASFVDMKTNTLEVKQYIKKFTFVDNKTVFFFS